MRPSFGKGCGDITVTVPQEQWHDWLDEGDVAGGPDEWLCAFCLPGLPCEVCDGRRRLVAGEIEWYFSVGSRPEIEPGGRVYVVAYGRLRGYAPLVRVEERGNRFALVRCGGAVACTITEPIKGFQGWRYRHWERGEEREFPEWQHVGVPSQPRLHPGA